MAQRDFSLDVIRVFATLGVVAIHTEVITSSPTNYLGGLSWWFANTIHSLVIVSVPLFVMLSGALLLHRPKMTYGYVWPKVLGQFLLPLGCWWLLYGWWRAEQTGIPWSFFDETVAFFTTRIGHLYFLQIIIGLYLCLPLLHVFLKRKIPTEQRQVLWVVTLGAILFQHLDFVLLRVFSTRTAFTIFLPYTSYLLWGYVLSKVKINHQRWWLVSMLILMLTMGISVATYLNTVAFNQGHRWFWSPTGGNFFWEPFTVPVMVLSGLMFVWLRNTPMVWPKLFAKSFMRKAVLLISELSFGVYLVHPFLIDRIDHYLGLAIHLIQYPLWIYYLQKILYVSLASLVVVAVIKQLPVVQLIWGVRQSKSKTR